MTDQTIFWELWALKKNKKQTNNNKKTMSTESSMSCSVGAWEIRLLKQYRQYEAWLVGFRREFKDSIRAVCYFELRSCHSSQLGLKSCHSSQP